jgi:hypothetical protein
VSFVDGGNGFAGQSSRRVHFGLGSARSVERLEIAWPSGRRQVFEDVAADRIWRAVEGKSELEPFTPESPGGAPIQERPGSPETGRTGEAPANPPEGTDRP